MHIFGSQTIESKFAIPVVYVFSQNIIVTDYEIMTFYLSSDIEG